MSARWVLTASACAAALAAVAWVVWAYPSHNGPPADTRDAVRPGGGHVEVLAADPGRGRPVFAERYGELEHGGHRQSWGAAQAPSGELFVANTSGVLRFDGADWTLFPTELGAVRMVEVLESGRVVAVGQGGYGALVPDSLGTLTFQMIVPADSLGGDEVWGVFEADGAVVLQTFRQLARVEGGRVVSSAYAPDGRRFHKAFDVDGDLVVRLEGTGLVAYGDGALQPFAGGEAFADVAVRALMDLDGEPGGALLVATDADLYRLDPAAEEPVRALPSGASATLAEGRAYHGCRIGQGNDAAYALTTFGQGVLVVDRAGAVVQRLGAGVGLTPDDLVLGCAVDAQGGLWLALSDGVLRVDAAAPFSAFDADDGLPGSVYDIRRHDGRLYVATERGVFRQTLAAPGERPRFEPVAPDQSTFQTWMLYSAAEELLAASTGGVFAIDGSTARQVMDGPAYAFAERPGSLGEVLVGHKSGIQVLQDRGAWRDAGALGGVDAEVGPFATTADAVWTMTRDGRLVRVGEDRVEVFGLDDGVPEGVVAAVARDGQLLLLAPSVIYTAERTSGRIRAEPHEALTALIGTVTAGSPEQAYYNLSKDAFERLWLSGPTGTRVLESRGERLLDVTPPALRGVAGVMPIHRDGDITFVGTDEGLYRLVGEGARYAVAGRANVQSLVAEDDGVLFGGAAREGSVVAPYGQALRFGFALPAFNEPGGTEYRSFLDGFDRRPSDWSADVQRDYTNLPPGDYTFRVEARTAQGALAQPAALAFTIPPPWYLTPWALGGYVVLGVLFVSGIATLSSQRERRKADAAAARAAELAELNDQLRAADRLKDDMLANTSHELRTPLTAIIGFSEILQEYEGGAPDEVRELAGHMFSGGRRLLRTVNDLLDIAQLRAGKLELKPRPVDAAAVARSVAAELRPLAAEKGIAFSVHPDGLHVPAHLDPDALARVLTNLISNAIKFTDHGGVAVLVDADGDTLRVAVQDSGIGIDPGFIPHLFDEYVQESRGHARRAEGSGLGLAITHRVVRLMRGSIDVVSEPGRGTRVTVELPVQAQAHVPEAPPQPFVERRRRDRRQGASRATDQPAPAASPPAER